MKKIIILLIIPFTLLSQDNEEKDTNKNSVSVNPYTNTIKWETNFIFESNGLNYSFLNDMLYGGYITNETKNKWLNMGDENNHLAFELSNGLSYKNSKLGFGVSILDRNTVRASFTDDLMRLVLEGNFKYQNETLDFSNTFIQATRFQQYKFNYTHNLELTNISSALSYLAGNHHSSFIINKGVFYTAENGTSLDIAYDMNVFITDTSNLNLFANNGNGIALDLGVDFIVKNYKINIYLQDLGYINWKESSTIARADSNFTFNGVEVEDIFGFNDSIINNQFDTGNKYNTINKKFKSYIPASFGFSVMRPSTSKYFKSISAGLNTKWQPYYDNSKLSFSKIGQGFSESGYSPMYWVSSVSVFKKSIIYTSLSYGGYTNDINLGLALSFGKRFNFTIGSTHLEHILITKNANAMSIYFNTSLSF